MKRIKYRTIFRTLSGIVLAAGMLLAPFTSGNVCAATITPIYLTDGDITRTVGGVTYTVRHDITHPVVSRTSAWGDAYNRLLTIYLYVTNNSGAPLTYSVLTGCTDASGALLVNADPLAAAKFCTIENGKSGAVVAQFLAMPSDNLSSVTFSYNHMNYSQDYINDMNLYVNGQMTLEQVALRHPATPLYFPINTLSMQ